MVIINNVYVNIPRQEIIFPFPGTETSDTYVFVAPELNE